MTVDALIFWLFVLAWAIVIGLLLFVQAPRIVTEIGRIVRHVVALVGGSALPLQIAKAEADAARIDAALARLPALEVRARAALATIRSTPIVPPMLAPFSHRVRSEMRDLQRELG